jgi:hypothetical protein
LTAAKNYATPKTHTQKYTFYTTLLFQMHKSKLSYLAQCLKIKHSHTGHQWQHYITSALHKLDSLCIITLHDKVHLKQEGFRRLVAAVEREAATLVKEEAV